MHSEISFRDVIQKIHTTNTFMLLPIYKYDVHLLIAMESPNLTIDKRIICSLLKLFSTALNIYGIVFCLYDQPVFFVFFFSFLGVWGGGGVWGWGVMEFSLWNCPFVLSLRVTNHPTHTHPHKDWFMRINCFGMGATKSPFVNRSVKEYLVAISQNKYVHMDHWTQFGCGDTYVSLNENEVIIGSGNGNILSSVRWQTSAAKYIWKCHLKMVECSFRPIVLAQSNYRNNPTLFAAFRTFLLHMYQLSLFKR